MHRRHKSLTATLSTENDHIRTRASKARKIFIKKSAKKILWVQGKYVTLQRFRRETGRLAQLVQSVCLTSRGSGVRIPQRPPRFSHRDANTDTPGRGPIVIDLSCRQHILGALSSAGSERLPYKQRVGGSNPSAPTTFLSQRRKHRYSGQRPDCYRPFLPTAYFRGA